MRRSRKEAEFNNNRIKGVGRTYLKGNLRDIVNIKNEAREALSKHMWYYVRTRDYKGLYKFTNEFIKWITAYKWKEQKKYRGKT